MKNLMNESDKSGQTFSGDDTIFNVINLDFVGTSNNTFDMTSISSFICDEQRTLTCELNNTCFSTSDEEGNRLTLAYEKLRNMPKSIISRFADSIQILDISHNSISNLDFLVHFKGLNSLIADNNLIDEHTTLPPMPHLKLIWFNHCKISKLHPWILNLHKSCPNLIYLSLMGNFAAPSYLNGGTFYEYLQYRYYVLSLFERLLHLDDRKITKEQQNEAVRLYRRPLFERLSSRNKDFPFCVSLRCSSKKTLRVLHQKMSIVLDKAYNPNGSGVTRNLLV